MSYARASQSAQRGRLTPRKSAAHRHPHSSSPARHTDSPVRHTGHSVRHAGLDPASSEQPLPYHADRRPPPSRLSPSAPRRRASGRLLTAAWAALLALPLLAILTTGVEAQTTRVLVSNTSAGIEAGFTEQNNDRIAQAFTTGSNSAGYSLVSFQIKYANALTEARLNNLTVTLRNANGVNPGDTVLGTFTKPSAQGGGLATFTAPGAGFELAASTTYFIQLALGNADGGAGAGYRVRSAAGRYSEDNGSLSDWLIADGGRIYYNSRWNPLTNDNTLQIELTGTVKTASTTPAAPTGFTIDTGDTEITLKWTDPDNSAITKYQYRQGTGPLGSITWGSWTDIPNSDADTTEYTVTGLTNGTRYYFQVRAAVGTTFGTATASTAITPVAKPAAPTSLTAAAGATQVTLSWSDPGNATIEKYQVRYGAGLTTDSGFSWGTWADVSSSGATTTSATVTGLTNGTEYTFGVRAVGPSGDGAGATVVATPLATNAPAAPTRFRRQLGEEQITLTWADPSNNAITKWQYRQGTGTPLTWGAWTDIPASNAGTTRYTVTGLTGGTRYSFQVRAVAGTVFGAATAARDGIPQRPPPVAPVLTATAGDARVTLTWPDPGDASISGAVYQFRTAGTDTWSPNRPIPSVFFTRRSFPVTQLVNGTDYEFRMRFQRGSTARGLWSNTVTATPLATGAAGAPTGFTATAGSGQVALAWTAPSGTITKYQVRQGTGDPVVWGAWADITGTTSHTVTGLTGGTAYSFQVRAVTGTSVFGAMSDTASATPTVPLPGVPGNVAAAAGDARVTLSWDDPMDNSITGYEYQQRVQGALWPDDWTSIENSASLTEYAVTGLTNGTTYEFHLAAVNTSGSSAPSATVSATPLASGVTTAQPNDKAVTEGDNTDTATFTVVLNTEPSSPVSVTVTAPTGLTLAGPSSSTFAASATVGFTASTWNTAQTVTVRATDDSTDHPSGRELAVTYSTSSQDSNYRTLTGTAATVTVTDDDATEVTLAGSATDVTEGATKDFTVTLNRGLVNGETLAVPLTFAGDATRNTDYTTACPTTLPTGVTCANLNSGNATVTFTGASGTTTATTVTLTLTATTDNTAEASGESVIIGLGTLNASSGTGLDGGASGMDSLTDFDIVDPDTTVPTVEITGVPDKINTRAAFTATFTFSEAVTGFDANDISVTNNANKGTFTASSTTVYTLTVTPTADADVKVTVAANAATDGTNTGPANAESKTATWDASAPTVAITGIPARIKDTTALTATFTFNEDVSDFGKNDITVTGATAGAFTETSKKVYTLTVTPSGDADVEVSVAADSATDGLNTGPASAQTATAVWTALVLSSATVTVVEEATATYTVALSSQPDANVTVTVGGASGEVTFDTVPGTAGTQTTALTFTTTNWETPQTVTVLAAADNDTATDTATLTHTAAGGGYDSVTANVAVTVTDNDTAGLVLDPTNLTVAEGGSNTYTVKLATQPTAEVTVAVAGAGGEVTVDTNTLTFSTTNWGTAQTVTVSAGQDNDATNDSATLTHSASGGGYGSITGTVAVTVTDDDSAGITTAATDDTATEGSTTATATFTVVLDTEPSSNVTVTVTAPTGLTLDGPDAGSVYATSEALTFTDSTWSTAQAVTVQASNDNTDSPSQRQLTVTYATTSTDTDYNALSGTAATVTVTDNDATEVTLAGSATDVTEGATKDFTVTLNRGLVNGETLAVPLTFAGDATRNTDYTTACPTSLPTGVTCANLNSGNATVTFTGASGTTTATTVTLTLTATTDSTAEVGGESVIIGLGTLNANSGTGLNGGASGTDTLADFDIIDPDTTAPTVEITGVPDKINTRAAFTVTFTFSEAVTGFDTDDVTVTNNADKGTFTATSATVYTLTITPTADADVKVTVAADAATDGVNTGPASAVSDTATWDASVPTLAITGVPEKINARDPFTATFTFSEAVTGFDTDDVTVTNNADKGTFTATSATVYTLTITPTADADVKVTVAADAATDGVNTGPATAQSDTAVWDASVPTVEITGVPAEILTRDPFTVTFTFSEDVTDFVTGDVTVTNGNKSNFAGSGDRYTLTVTPNANADVTVTVAADAASDGINTGPASAETETAKWDVNVAFASETASVTEAANAEVSLTVTLTSARTAATTVFVQYQNVTATRAGNADYTGSPTSVTVPAGDTSATLTIPITNDDATESTETFLVRLLTTQLPTGVTLGSPREVTVTITDDDAPPAAPGAPTGLSATAGDTQVVLTWTDPSNADITAWEVRQGSGSPLSWGSWTEIAGSTATTTTHTVTGLTNGTAYSFELRAKAGTVIGTASSTVTATPAATPTVALSASATTVTEGGSAVTITATRSAANTSGSALSIPIAVKAADTTAQAGDYTLAATTISLPNNATTGTTTLTATTDSTDEPYNTEAVVIELGTPPAGTNKGSPAEVTVTLIDNNPTTVTLAATAGDITEGGAKPFTVTSGRALVSGEVLPVPLTFTGTATRNTDYTVACPATLPTGVSCNNLNTAATPTVTFTGPAAMAVTVTLTSTTDSTTESGGETVDIGLGTLNANSGTNLGGGAAGTDNLDTFTIAEPPATGTLALTVDAIATDNTVNIAEKAAGFTITGTTGSESGASVTVVVGTQTFTAVTSDSTGAWSVSVPADANYITGTSVTVTVDATKNGFTAATQQSRTLTIDLTAPTAPTYTAPGSLQVGVALTAINPTGGSGIKSTDGYEITGQPAGLTINADTGAISGTPTTANTATAAATVTVRDTAGNEATVGMTFPAVDKGTQTLTGFAYSPTSVRVDASAPTLSPPSGAQGALSYATTTPTVCTVNAGSGALTLVAPGTCTVTVTAAATTNYNAATATATVTVTAAGGGGGGGGGVTPQPEPQPEPEPEPTTPATPATPATPTTPPTTPPPAPTPVSGDAALTLTAGAPLTAPGTTAPTPNLLLTLAAPAAMAPADDTGEDMPGEDTGDVPGDTDDATVPTPAPAMAPPQRRYDVRLATRPSGPVTLVATSSDPNIATVSAAVQFTVADWTVPQGITVTALAPGWVGITHRFEGGGYDGQTLPELIVRVGDGGTDPRKDSPRNADPAAALGLVNEESPAAPAEGTEALGDGDSADSDSADGDEAPADSDSADGDRDDGDNTPADGDAEGDDASGDDDSADTDAPAAPAAAVTESDAPPPAPAAAPTPALLPAGTLATLARGQLSAAQAVLGARLSAAPGTERLTVAGRTLSFAALLGGDTAGLDTAAPRDLTTLAVPGVPGLSWAQATGQCASWTQTDCATPTGEGTESPHTGAPAGMWETLVYQFLSGQLRSAGLSAALWQDSGFALDLSAGGDGTDGTPPGRRWTLWGQGQVQGLTDLPAELGGAGAQRTGYLGLDTALGERGRVGLALSHSFDASALRTVHPYLSITHGATRIAVLGGVGHSTGTATPARRPSESDTARRAASPAWHETLRAAPLRLHFGRVDVAHPLATVAGLTVDARVDAAWARLVRLNEAGRAFQGETVRTVRAGLSATGTQVTLPAVSGLALSPTFAVRLREDAGADVSGRALALEGALDARYAPWRLTLGGHWLTRRSVRGTREQGARATLARGQAGQVGPFVSVTTRWGDHAGGGESLWGERFDYRAHTTAPARAWTFEARGGYGWALTPTLRIDSAVQLRHDTTGAGALWTFELRPAAPGSTPAASGAPPPALSPTALSPAPPAGSVAHPPAATAHPER